jgi:hypothetical protein
MNSGCGGNQTRHCGALPTKQAARSARIAVRDAAVATQVYGNIHDGSAGSAGSAGHVFTKRACTPEGTNGRCAVLTDYLVAERSTLCRSATTTVRMELCARALVASGFRALNDIRGTRAPCTGGSRRRTLRMWPTWRNQHSRSLKVPCCAPQIVSALFWWPVILLLVPPIEPLASVPG